MMDDAQKYQILIVNKIKYRLKKWMKRKSIFEKEIFLFLNKTIDAANIIHLTDLSQIALDKLHYITEASTREWSTKKWQAFLIEIITYVDQNPILDKANEISNVKQEDNIILLIDNDFDFITYMKNELEKNGYHVIIALDAEKGLEVFYTMKPLFVLLDINLKDGKSLFDLKQLMEVSQSLFTPVAIVSGEDVDENRIAAYSIGATDFISKPVNLKIFRQYLKNRIEYRQKVLESITIDELTKTYNRKHMNNGLDTALKMYRQKNIVFSVAMLDLDHFKKVNDLHGHLVGDKVLEKIASIMTKKLDEKDLVFRYGGEEFLIYFHGKNADEATEKVDQIRQEFNEELFSAEGNLFKVTFSAGITAVDQYHQTVEDIIDDSDKALYDSKKNGRNRTTIYSIKSTPSYEKLLNVIIVDDDGLMRTILKDSFSEWELDNDITVTVEAYKNGKDFLSASWYRSNEKYLILLDGVMPGMDGVEVLTEVRSNYPEKNIVISMLTSRSGEENIAQALIKGADDYMLKSLKVEEIMTRSETLVRRMKL